MGKDDEHRIGKAEGGVTREVMRPRPMAGNVRKREIVAEDLGAIAKLLAHGFTRSTPLDWMGILEKLSRHPTPVTLPRYGYLIESGRAVVGVILVISSVVQTDGAMSLRSNLSSWYVLPPFRGYAPLLLSRLLKNPDVTYVNVSPAPHTLPIILAQGFVPLSSGKFFVPINPFARLGNAKVQLIKPDDSEIPGLDQFERDLLLAHARYGCISVSCQTPDGAYPFVFRPRLIKRRIPSAQLIYCRDIADLARLFGPVGRSLGRRGRFMVSVDSDRPIEGLRGLHVMGVNPKYYRGPARPRVGDLAYTESAMFGI
jgi:hypothetical protein